MSFNWLAVRFTSRLGFEKKGILRLRIAKKIANQRFPAKTSRPVAQNDIGGEDQTTSTRARAREDRRWAAVRYMISGSVICGRKPLSAYSFSTEGTRRCISS